MKKLNSKTGGPPRARESEEDVDVNGDGEDDDDDDDEDGDGCESKHKNSCDEWRGSKQKVEIGKVRTS